MRVTAVVPSLDPDEKLQGVVESLLAVGFTDIILVNDGSHENAVHYFEEAAAHPEVTVLTHEVNRGKGRAMKTAFAWVLENRPESTGVVTVDGDGQHLAPDVLRVAEAMEAEPEKMWLGVRDFSLEQVPKRSRTGNNLTKGVLRLFCGVKVSDSQTGLRAFSKQLLPFLLKVEGERYEMETQMLLDAKRRHIELGEVVIETVYIDENQTSHYRPFRDSMRIMKIIFKYVISSLVATLIDLIVFTLLNAWILRSLPDASRILISSVVARVFSTLVNYNVNRKYVFHDEGGIARSLKRYYTLAAGQILCSYALVYLLTTLLHTSNAVESVLKMFVDMVLFFVCYRVQLHWVFAPNQKEQA